jgi:5-methyltetrahydropteroyltriglutamate--homocysteine methyltransferase
MTRRDDVQSATLGFPRIGHDRELKTTLEDFWSDDIDRDTFDEQIRQLQKQRWRTQADAGIDIIPANDLSIYDHVLDTAWMVGAIPEQYRHIEDNPSLDTYFAMARGHTGDTGSETEALEMTKWFDTNYHYIVPELTEDQTFDYHASTPVRDYRRAVNAGYDTRPVILGPVSFLQLSKATGDFSTLTLLDELLPVYKQLLADLEEAGAQSIQIDEPCLVVDQTDEQRQAYRRAYNALRPAHELSTTVATYFGELRDNLPLALDLPVDGLHLDLARGEELDDALDHIGDDQHLSLGLIDGRNVWRADLDARYQTVERALGTLGPSRLHIAPSCSLLYVPLDVERESSLDDDVRSWLAFAHRKLDEVAALTTAANQDPDAAEQTFEACRQARDARKDAASTSNQRVQNRLDNIDDQMTQRSSPFPKRKPLQEDRLGLPTFPTTTIGSFPQRSEIRSKRAKFNRGDIDRDEYDSFIKDEITRTIRAQEDIGLDLLVHGESERSDMVEYFGQQLDGYAFTDKGWVQSYGSRCVRPPIIYGDIERPEPMTVDSITYADGLTDRPVKGILTGPVTMLQWSFVRDDQPRSETARQLALAIRDEVADLEDAGIPAIQVDEPAIREGLPLRTEDQQDYLDWAVEAFRLSTCVVEDDTQIQTHMCYSDFNTIIESVAALDADVLFIESSRSNMRLLEVFEAYEYPNDIGLGVYDIHSPRIPSTDEMYDLLTKALESVGPEKIWVNPDCGLKTRNWDEVRPSLEHLVQAAERLRSTHADD